MKIAPLIASLRIRLADRFCRKAAFSSADDAFGACKAPGYDSLELARVVYEKMAQGVSGESVRARLIRRHGDAYNAIKLLIREAGKKEIGILDFGGACGEYYFAIRGDIPDGVNVRWYVVETESMCGYGRRLENGELVFMSGIDRILADGIGIDLICVSGSLQYARNPYKALEDLLKVGAEYMVFSRMCYTSSATDVTVIQRNMLSWHASQSLPKVVADVELNFPFTIFSWEKFDSILRRNYGLIDSFRDETGKIRARNIPVFGLGVVYKLR